MSKVFVITGPSGVGKGTLINGILKQLDGLEVSVSATTRRPRPGERDGRQYHFLSDKQFDDFIAEGRFLEYASYSGSRYGTLISEVEERLSKGTSVVMEIEVQGARQIRKKLPEAVQIFIAPPSYEDLRERLQSRGAESSDQIELRLLAAREEIDAQSEFAHVVINDKLDDALKELLTTVSSYLAK